MLRDLFELFKASMYVGKTTVPQKDNLSKPEISQLVLVEPPGNLQKMSQDELKAAWYREIAKEISNMDSVRLRQNIFLNRSG